MTTKERGYGAPHQRERDRWKPLVELGEVCCVRCGRLIPPGGKWMLGHDHVHGGYIGIEHYRCGLREKNRRNARERRVRGIFPQPRHKVVRASHTSRAW